MLVLIEKIKPLKTDRVMEFWRARFTKNAKFKVFCVYDASIIVMIN